MIDLIPYVAGLLSPLGAQIEQSFSDTSVAFPLIVIQQIADTGNYALDGAETFANMTVQIDAYTLDKDETYTLSQNIDAILAANKFRRTNAFPVTEGELERYQMTFTAGIDVFRKQIN